MKILVIRHGQTDWNALGRLQGQTDIKLNNIGRNQAQETSKKIQNEKIDLIITSPLKRAKETAEIINKRFNVPIIEDDRLMERKYGKSEGLTKKEIQEMKKDNPDANEVWNYNKNVDFNEIETMKYFCNRIYSFLNDIIEKYKNKNILIVTHGGVTVPIKCYFMKYPLENLIDRNFIRRLENCEVIEFLI
jgi:broad specificity phosphatase PhoE